MSKILCAIFLFLAIGFGIFDGVVFEQASLKTANLKLADDASTPEQKATFLRAFIADMDRDHPAEYAAWIFKSERNRISNQRIVIESLIKRCDDLSTLNKESMGYSQGMTQITGQEFDHAVTEINSIYEDALVMSWGWFMLNAWWMFAIAAVLSCVVVAHDAEMF